jgi:hypothetical protein
MRNALLSVTVLAMCAGAAPSVAPAAPAKHAQVLFFDAILTRVQTTGPGPSHVGHRQIASGVLRDASGRRTGTFSFVCVWTKVERGRATEHCTASALTTDGRLDAAGPSQSNSSTHIWRLDGGTARYHHASGALTVRDLGDRESLISATVTSRGASVLRAGKVGRPAANDRFIARANGLCRQATGELATLPPFPFEDFDPLRPDPSLLPAVGAFFTGPGDPRPILIALNRGLTGLGAPAANRGVWRALLGAREHELRVIDDQDRAALATDVPTFVRSVRESANTFRQIAISATVFGVSSCVL